MTHAELVDCAALWLRVRRRCCVVFTEATILTDEIPDAIGWGSQGWSIIIECKTSRADFFRDLRKWHRRGTGMGNRRYYLTEPGLIRADELPSGWGLLEWNGRLMRIMVDAEHRPERSTHEEIKLLIRHRRGCVTVPVRKIDKPQETSAQRSERLKYERERRQQNREWLASLVPKEEPRAETK